MIYLSPNGCSVYIFCDRRIDNKNYNSFCDYIVLEDLTMNKCYYYCLLFSIGYYRVEYDYECWRMYIIPILKSEERTKIYVLNRAQLIEDVCYLWTKKKLDIIIIRQLIYSIWYEEQCAPWYAMQNMIQKMWNLLNINDGESTKHAIVVVLDQLLKKVGYTEHSNDTECIKFKRLLATKWACRLLHRPCLEIAQKRLLEHLEDPEINIISPMWEEWTYCNGLVSSDLQTWSSVFAEYQRTGNKRILKYLTCSKNISIISDYLDLAMANNSVVSKGMLLNSEDYKQIYCWIIKKHISSKEVLNVVLEKIKQMKINDEFIEKISYIIENVYSVFHMLKIQSFFREDIDLDRTLYNKLIDKTENQILRITKLPY